MIAIEQKAIVANVQAIPPTPNLVVWGFHVAETAGATAAVTIIHGTLTTDPVLVPKTNLAANAVGLPVFFKNPINCPKGILIVRGSGTTTVIIYVDTQP